MKERMILILILLFCFSYYIRAQENSIFIKRIDKNKILKWENGNETIVYESPLYKVERIQITQKNRYVSAIEVTKGKYEKSGNIEWPKNRFVIITSDGQDIKYLNEDVRRYAWNPDEKRIAVITGEFRESEVGFAPEKLLIFDRITEEIEFIHGIEYPYDIHWGENGHILYIKDSRSRIYRYFTDTKKLELTDLKDLHLSPDEEYYVKFPHPLLGIVTIQIYETETNRHVHRTIPEELGKPIRWAFNHGHFLLFEKKEEEMTYRDSVQKDDKSRLLKDIKVRFITRREIHSITYSVYNVKEGKIVKAYVTSGDAHGWIGSSNSLVLMNDGG